MALMYMPPGILVRFRGIEIAGKAGGGEERALYHKVRPVAGYFWLPWWIGG
jgi:hypothetical protein